MNLGEPSETERATLEASCSVVLTMHPIPTFVQERRQRAEFPPTVTLRLRPKNRVKWGEDVVDNEGMGKRKSNKCCIFHKRKMFGESSSESENSSGAESGSDSPRRRGSDRALPRRQREKCSCEPGDEVQGNADTGFRAGGAGAARRGPFTRRIQETDTTSIGDENSYSVEAQSAFAMSPSLLALSPLSLGSEMRGSAGARAREGEGESDRNVADAVFPPLLALSEHDTRQLWIDDLLTDAAAVELIQAENIRPPC